MTDDLVVERNIELDRPVADVWSLVGEANGWQQWLVDAAAIDVAEGAVGSVLDDGRQRRVHVTQVDERSSLTFRWWETDDPAGASEVTITVHEVDEDRTRVQIVERPLLSTAARTVQASVWEVRACLLAMSLQSLARV